MKKLLFLIVALTLFSSVTFAQFEVGKSYIGPSIGIGFGGYGLSLGADYEYGMSLKDIGVDAPGALGIGGLVRYYSWSESFIGYKWSYTDIIIGAQANYHFKLENNKIDPFVGLVLGFDIASSSWDGPSGIGNSYSVSNGGLFFNGNVGVRYWFSPTMAARVGLGFGNIVSSLILGVDFKF